MPYVHLPPYSATAPLLPALQLPGLISHRPLQVLYKLRLRRRILFLNVRSPLIGMVLCCVVRGNLHKSRN